jgi:hypothetical protein
VSGALAQFRTPTRPLTQDIEFPNPAFEEGGDEPETIKVQMPVPHPTKTKLVSVPLPAELVNETNKGWHSVELAAQRHVLDYRLTQATPGKHAKGRAKPTNRERRVGTRDGLRAAQARMTAAEDAKRLG